MSEAIATAAAPAPGGGYSQGIRAGHLLFISGQTPRRRDRTLLDAPIGAQVELAIDNVEAIAEAAGASLANAVQVTVYLREMAHQAEMDAVFCRRFQLPRPARTTVQSDLPVAVEIDAIIEVPSNGA